MQGVCHNGTDQSATLILSEMCSSLNENSPLQNFILQSESFLHRCPSLSDSSVFTPGTLNESVPRVAAQDGNIIPQVGEIQVQHSNSS